MSSISWVFNFTMIFQDSNSIDENDQLINVAPDGAKENINSSCYKHGAPPEPGSKSRMNKFNNQLRIQIQ